MTEPNSPAVRGPLDAPVVPLVPSRDVLADLQRAASRKWQGNQACQQAGLFARAAAEIERLRAAPFWWRCDTHGMALLHNAWGCPECVRDLRGEVKKLQKELGECHVGWESGTKAIEENLVLRTALDKIAERTSSDDPCRAMVQIARDALRHNV